MKLTKYLEFTKVKQPWQLEGAPAPVADTWAEQIQREGGRHWTEELENGEEQIVKI